MIKTTITIQKPLFDQAEKLAQQLNISRNHLYGLAIETFIKNYQNQQLLDELNLAYADAPDLNEKALLVKMRNRQRKLMENEY